MPEKEYTYTSLKGGFKVQRYCNKSGKLIPTPADTPYLVNNLPKTVESVKIVVYRSFIKRHRWIAAEYDTGASITTRTFSSKDKAVKGAICMIESINKNTFEKAVDTHAPINKIQYIIYCEDKNEQSDSPD